MHLNGPRGLRLVLPFALILSISAASATPADCAAGPATARCSCGGTASIGRAMDSATLVAIAVLDTTGSQPSLGNVPTWSLRIERAWKWPGGGAAPPRHVVVARRPDGNACSVEIIAGQRQLVVASVRAADGMLVLGHKCATPWGAVDTLGATADNIRQFGGAVALRNVARAQEQMLDSLRTHGPGVEPVR